MRTLLACLLILQTAWAEDTLDKQEKRWVEQCITALSSPSERVRRGASRALSQVGVAAVPTIVKMSTRLKTPEAWDALTHACLRMDRMAVRKALEDLRAKWPVRARESFDALQSRLIIRVPYGDPEVGRKVRAILNTFGKSNSYQSDDPSIDQIVAFGRDAVPELLRALEERDATEITSGFSLSFRKTAIADALKKLVIPEDRPSLIRILRGGVNEAATVLATIPGEESRDAILGLIREGKLDHVLLDALDVFRDDPDVQATLIEALQKIEDNDNYKIGFLAELLGEAQCFQALPVLKQRLTTAEGLQNRRMLAVSVTLLGGQEGIRALIDLLGESGRGGPRYNQHTAGETLDNISGKDFYKGEDGGPDSRGPRGNFKEAKTAYDAWWTEVQGKLKYDRDTLRWIVP